MKKVILCFGDSNTWGYNPENGERFGPEIRWTGILQAELGADYSIVEEGLNARTTVFTDPVEGTRIDRNGRNHLAVLLDSHRPIDLVIVMLGLNDLKRRFAVSASDIAQGAGELVQIVQCSQSGRQNRAPDVLLIAPPPVKTLSILGELFDGAIEKSQKFGRDYAWISQRKGCQFINAAEITEYDPTDGIHLGPPGHATLGRHLANWVRGRFASSQSEQSGNQR
jgi:lysophospholipase L1-like esterase